jgi:hypothetical protein
MGRKALWHNGARAQRQNQFGLLQQMVWLIIENMYSYKQVMIKGKPSQVYFSSPDPAL